MAGLTDFLFNGSPPPATTTYGSTSTSLPPWLENYFQGMVGRANVVAGEPYQPYGGPRVAGFNADQNSAFATVRNNVGAWNPYAAQGTAPLTEATQGPNPADAGMGYIAQAGQGPSATDATAPYLTSASQTWPGAANSYMNPYTSNVVDRIGQLAGRNMSENIMPSINDVFIKNGQFGSTQHGEIAGRAARDVNDSALAAQGQALQQGYTSSANIFNQDANRAAQVAGIAGTAAGTDMSARTNMGAAAGNLANTSINSGINLANAWSGLGTTASQAGLRDAAALQSVGDVQQTFGQKNLDTAYGDFVEQRNYPRDMVAFMNSAIRGVPATTSTTSANTGPSGSYQPAPLSQLLGYGLGISQLGKVLGAKRGGHISKNARPRPIVTDQTARGAGFMSRRAA